jgi:hypothetical protein
MSISPPFTVTSYQIQPAGLLLGIHKCPNPGWKDAQFGKLIFSMGAGARETQHAMEMPWRCHGAAMNVQVFANPHRRDATNARSLSIYLPSQLIEMPKSFDSSLALAFFLSQCSAVMLGRRHR